MAFDEGSGKVAEDSSGNDRYGEVRKALKWIILPLIVVRSLLTK